ncbi:MAG TPA: M56 family metallopeptidase [Longimicrobium sp.]|jgi:beta-lactamase regulating signal transducer with metallopeptidase domain|uniref:M56 family metallopeptidase n=1 Tax=Longimicrobium sp. TaxID=2029185 RepID=UPI002ED95B1D
MLSLLVRASLEGAVLAAGVWLACRALPRLSPGARALLWWCVAAKFVVSLVWLSPIGVPVLPRAAAEAPGAEAGVTAATPLPPARAGDGARPAFPPARDAGAPEIPWTAIVVGAWALGLGLSLLRTLQSWRRTRAVVARSLPGGKGLHAIVRELSGRLGLRRTADVRVSAEVGTPLVIGGRRPVILVPAAAFAALAADQQRMALCHELAHLKRGDVWLGCVPAAAERCFFFHPLARLAAREYAFWREAACDEAVLTTLGASPQGYGRMLLALGVSRRTATFSAAGAAWSFQNLKRRLTMLNRTSSPSRRGRVLAAGAVALAMLAIVPIRAVARSAAPAAPSPSRTAGAPEAAATRAASPAARADAPAAVTAGTAKPGDRRSQEELHFVLFRGDRNTTVNGSTRDIDRARRHRRPGEHLLWFRYAGREYVVRDAGVLRQVDELWEPVGRIGEEQGRIGARQGEIGEVQGRIGAQLSEIGARQGRLGERLGVLGARLGALAAREAAGASDAERRAMEREREELEEESRRLEEQMEALDEEMRQFDPPMDDRGGEMEALGREMEALGERMEAAAERANAGMLALVRRAIQDGAAVAVE